MTDYAAYFREVLYTKEDLAALDALIAERDEARRTRFQANNMIVVPEDELIRERAENARLRVCITELEAALTHYRGGTPRKEGGEIWK